MKNFKIIINALAHTENIERLIAQREGLFGKEMIFTGDVRTNKFFNEPEFIVGDVKEINLDDLIKRLQEIQKELLEMLS